MTAIWHFYWPVLVIAAIVGLVAGTADVRLARRDKHYFWRSSGVVAAAAIAAIWHGPFGAGNRLASSVERAAQVALGNYEMTAVTARLERAPLSRTLVLSGPADDFQQRELVRILEQVPGVGQARWDRPIERPKGP